jgi:light-regulated signal transduction histidine kinase (bacteriophytochrome)
MEKEKLKVDSIEINDKFHHQVNQLEGLETKSRQTNEIIPKRKILISVLLSFIFLFILTWLNEILDLPHFLMGAPKTPINWRESILESITYFLVGIFIMTTLARTLSKNKKDEENLQKILKDLERSNAELQQFAYVTSHDLQEPLRMVASYVQLLERRYRGKFDSDADEFIAFTVDGVNRMKALINDLLLYSRVETQGQSFELTDMERVLSQTLINLRFAIEQNGAIVTHDTLPHVMADSAQMIQVVQNLIENAIKFHSEKPPKIHIGAKKDDSEWIFSVRDNGIGIDPLYFSRLFVIFQRLHGRNEYPGTGIGLAVCKRIVEHHGGRIWVESQLGQGATFYFTIPIKRR